MQYQGGKFKLAKKFAPILVEALAEGGLFYEPFVGGFNLVPALRKAGARLERVVCNDIHPGLKVLYEAVRDGWWIPRGLDEAEWKRLRADCNWGNPKTTFAAFGCSFGGKEWGGYARNNRNAQGQKAAGPGEVDHRYDFALAARQSILKKKPFLDGVEFRTGDYRALEVEPGAVVYCDPPYAGTTGYSRGVVGAELVAWCEALAARGCRVFLSEFVAPHDWKVVWTAERVIDLGRGPRMKRVEILACPGDGK